MGVIYRYTTAFKRRHRSAGFGIHSPHAFRFVTSVLCGRLPYYAYHDIAAMRQEVIKKSGSHWPHQRIISLKNAKMLFRIVNHFNPAEAMQIGVGCGITCASMLIVNSKSHITLYEPHSGNCHSALDAIPHTYSDRISHYTHMQHAIAAYKAKTSGGELPFIIINDIPQGEQDYPTLLATLTELMTGECVVVIRNIARKQIIKQLWRTCQQSLTMGQTFTNGKIAVVVASPKLQREDFLLWF